MSNISNCKGCNQFAMLYDGVCDRCLTSPKRGREWAEKAYKCRTDPVYALAMYSQINTQKGRELFQKMFGLPPGAGLISKPKVASVQ